MNGQDGYELINLDDDGIPELVEIGNCEAVGCRIVNFYKGEVCVAQLSRLGFSYIDGKNLLCNSDGLMGYYYDIVYSIVDEKMTWEDYQKKLNQVFDTSRARAGYNGDILFSADKIEEMIRNYGIK